MIDPAHAQICTKNLCEFYGGGDFTMRRRRRRLLIPLLLQSAVFVMRIISTRTLLVPVHKIPSKIYIHIGTGRYHWEVR